MMDYLKVNRLSLNCAEKNQVKSKQSHLSKLDSLTKCKKRVTEEAGREGESKREREKPARHRRFEKKPS